MNDLSSTTYRFGSYRLEAKDRTLLRDNIVVALAPKEFDTLVVLVENAGRLVTKEELITQIWPDTFVGDGSLARNISVLRKALGDDLIQTVPKLGYRFTAAVTHPAHIGDSRQSTESERVAPEPPGSADLHGLAAGTLPPQADSTRGWAVSIFLLVLTVSLFAYREVRKPKAQVRIGSDVVRIAVLPFDNFTDSESDGYICDGLTEAMISELSRLNGEKLKVIARTSAMQYRKTSKSIPQIGRELSVDYILESSVRGSGERLRVTSQLVRASDAMHVWTGEYERGFENVLDLQQQIAVAIAAEINLTLAPGKPEPLAQKRTLHPEAYRYYLLGRYHWNERNRSAIIQSLADFQKSAQADPNYARAYSGMADTYLLLAWWGIMPYREAYSRSEEAAQMAMRLESSLSEPYASLGMVKFMHRLDWPAAEENFRKALALDPNYATGHHWYAQYLAAMRRPDEAIAEIKRALELDPLSLAISQNAGFIYIQAGRYDQAILQLQKALEIDPENQVTHGYLALGYEWKHQYDRALNEFQTAQKLSHGFVPYAAGIAHVYALTGRTGQAREILRKLAEHRRREEVSAYSFAVVYAALGERDKAFAWLGKSIEERSCTIAEFNNDPALDVLRADPRFAEIRRQLRLTS